VIFDPDVYPLNWALVDGRVSEEYYREEHELDYDRMMAAEPKRPEEANPVSPAPHRPAEERSL
jgi:hypothetical protein